METREEAKTGNQETSAVRSKHAPKRQEDQYPDVFKGFGSGASDCDSRRDSLSNADIQYHPQICVRLFERQRNGIEIAVGGPPEFSCSLLRF